MSIEENSVEHALKLALEALQDMHIVELPMEDLLNWNKAIKALEEALANHIPDDTKMVSGVKDSLTTQQEQGEPLCTAAMFDDAFLAKSGLSPDTKLYTTPPSMKCEGPQQRKPLMQPIIKDAHGVLRFKKNGLVDALYEHGVKTGLGLNELHCMDFTVEDRQQFAQLIGYSVEGYGSLSYVTDEAYDAAAEAAHGIKE